MVKIDSQRISFNDLGIEKRAKEAGLLIPIGDVPAYNASDYKNVAVDVGGADNAEALVDVKEYGIASVPYYLEQAKNNPTYKRNITGAPEINFVREGTAKKIQEANNF